MPETPTEAAKSALMPGTHGIGHGAVAGVTAFGGFALGALVGNKVAPYVQRLMGNRKLPVISAATIARAATVVATGFLWHLAKGRGVGKMSAFGVSVENLLFWGFAGACANFVGSLLLDAFSLAPANKYLAKGTTFLATLTGIGGAGAGTAGEASAQAA